MMLKIFNHQKFFARSAAFGLVMIILHSCIHLNPKFRADNCFSGLDESFVKSGNIEREIVFIIHGIGKQEQNYSYEMIEGLGKNLLGKDFTYKTDCPVSLLENAMEKMVLRSKDTLKELVVYSLTWSIYSDSIKNSLRQTEFGRRPFNRNISEMVKNQIMIDRAGDLFFAQHSEILPKILKTIDTAFVDADTNEYDLENLNIISGSLGSQVFLKYLSLRYAGFLNDKHTFVDSVIHLKKEDSLLLHKIELNHVNSDVLENQFDNFTGKLSVNLNFFMLTNQYNLMYDNFKTWGGIESNTETYVLKPKFENINVVSFKNPNDMLCFTLPQNFLEGNSNTPPHIINIWYWNLIFRNNIISAHTVPFKLKKIYKAVSLGSRSNWVNVMKKSRIK